MIAMISTSTKTQSMVSLPYDQTTETCSDGLMEIIVYVFKI